MVEEIKATETKVTETKAAETKVAEDEQRFQLLQDPCKDRPLDDAACPRLIARPLNDEQLWPKDDLPDWKLVKDFLSREGPISKPQMIRLLN